MTIAELGWSFVALTLIGAVYICASGMAVDWLCSRVPAPAADYLPVTILKPLHGDEAGLLACLRGFCVQDYPGAVQIVFGVRDRTDSAIAVVHELARLHPTIDMQLVVDPRTYGANLKISNLVNMEQYSRYSILVIADSDISVPPDYLRRLIECARTMVLSIMAYSLSASAARYSKTLCQTPFSAQRLKRR